MRAKCEVCGREGEVERIGVSAPVLCGARAGMALPHPERTDEPPPEAWEAWR